jgi:hypothetical protein
VDSLRQHQCLIYQGDPSRRFLSLASTLETKLKWNYRCIFLGSPGRVTDLRRCMEAVGINAAAELAQGNLIFSSEQHVFDGRFDANGLATSLAETVEQSLRDGYAGLWVTGDVVWEIGSANESWKLPEYERLVEDLFREYPQLGAVCQYHVDAFPPEAIREALLVHPTIYLDEYLSRVNPHYVNSADHARAATHGAALDSAIRNLIQPASAKLAIHYWLKTSAGEFQICYQAGHYLPAFEGKRIGRSVYVHPQFVVDDLIAGVVELPERVSSAKADLPEDLRQWIRLNLI